MVISVIRSGVEKRFYGCKNCREANLKETKVRRERGRGARLNHWRWRWRGQDRFKRESSGLPWGLRVKNPPASAGAMGADTDPRTAGQRTLLCSY